jgi:hypothetical protein
VQPPFLTPSLWQNVKLSTAVAKQNPAIVTVANMLIKKSATRTVIGSVYFAAMLPGVENFLVLLSIIGLNGVTTPVNLQ